MVKLFGLSEECLAAPGRERTSCEARALAAWAILEFSSGSLVEAGRRLGRDPSTLTCAIRRIERMMREDDFKISEKAKRLHKELMEDTD